MSKNFFNHVVKKAMKLHHPKPLRVARKSIQNIVTALSTLTVYKSPKPLNNRPNKSVNKTIATDARFSTTKRKNKMVTNNSTLGWSFQRHTFNLNDRTLDYKLFLPATHSRYATKLPMLVMLHGCGQTPDDFAIGTGMNRLAQERELIVAYPEQTRAANASQCWNWFNPGDQERGDGEPALIAGLTQHVLKLHNGDSGRVYIAGLSAGGATAAIVASAYPEIFAAVGVHSGLPIGAASGNLSALIAMRAGSSGTRQSVPMPTIVFHGGADDVVNPRNGRAVTARSVATFDGLSETTLKGRDAGGHAYQRTMHRGASRKSFSEHWHVEGAGHAWSGGDPAGNFTDAAGPDASHAMVRFFLQHRLGKLVKLPA